MKSKTRKSKETSLKVVTVSASSPFPDPCDLLLEAEKETAQSDLKKYTATIATLRKKGFSFRQIAEWLDQRGIPADHNGVYRVYTKHVHPAQVAEIEERLEEEENV